MDIDCDGQRTARCNEDTDPWFQPDTACLPPLRRQTPGLRRDALRGGPQPQQHLALLLVRPGRRDLGINPDPENGGTDGPVTYICFKNSKVSPIESNSAATSVGEGRAGTFVANN